MGFSEYQTEHFKEIYISSKQSQSKSKKELHLKMDLKKDFECGIRK